MKLGTTLAVVLLAVPVFAADLSIPITVEEPLGIARKAAPVCGGIPLPWGVYKKNQYFALKEVPSQVVPLVVDEKGYLRWVLLDFQTDLKPNEKRVFTFTTATPPPKPIRPLATDTGNGVRVDTGKIKFTVAKDKPFSLLIAEQPEGWMVRVRDEGGGFDPTGVPDPLNHVESDHGRGLFLIRHFMDAVIYFRFPGGTAVQLEKRKTAPG